MAEREERATKKHTFWDLLGRTACSCGVRLVAGKLIYGELGCETLPISAAASSDIRFEGNEVRRRRPLICARAKDKGEFYYEKATHFLAQLSCCAVRQVRVRGFPSRSPPFLPRIGARRSLGMLEGRWWALMGSQK